VHTSAKPGWQQLTALVSLGAGGAITGFSFVPGTTADLTSPAAVPVHLAALEQTAKPTRASDATLRSAIVNVAGYYLRMAQTKTPAEMEAVIWQHDSIDGVDHGQSCAAFASLVLELGAQVVGQQSWVTGGGSYPWPLHEWADARVNPNPASKGIISIQQDAAAHDRWHPLGDGYQPQPGDWVVFDGHVEVVTGHSGGVLQTIGGDSLPNFSVNAHDFSGPLAAQGIVGFVNNGALAPAATAAAAGTGSGVQAGGGTPAAAAGGSQAPSTAGTPAQGPGSGQAPGSADPQAQPAAVQGPAAVPGAPAPGAAQEAAASAAGAAAIPGTPSGPPDRGHAKRWLRRHHEPRPSRIAPVRRSLPQPASAGDAAVPGTLPGAPTAETRATAVGAAVIPGLPGAGHHHPARSAARQPAAASARAPRSTTRAAAATPANATSAQQAFIEQIAPGAVATQQRYGVPAAVTIAQAIDESGWGLSSLATKDHNLFGMKGTGPAGSDPQPTQEFENGRMVSQTASFRVYRGIAESIDDHGKLLATSGYYTHAMSVRHDPNAFAEALTGIYATDPEYGAKLVTLMQQYDLYRYDSAAPTPASHAPAPSAAAIPGVPAAAPAGTGRSSTAGPGPTRTSSPAPAPSSQAPSPRPSPSSTSGPAPAPTPTSSPSPAPSRTPAPTSSPSPAPSRTPAPPSTSSRTPARGRTPAAAGAAQPAGTPRPARTPETARSSGPARTTRSARTPAAERTGVPVPSARSGRTASPARAATPAATTTRRAGRSPTTAPAIETVSAVRLPKRASSPARQQAGRRPAPARRYQQSLPVAVKNSFIAVAKVPIIRMEPLYRDVASNSGIRWELLAACDWMQCESRARHSPVHGEKLGARNTDGTVYRTKSEALAQCADDLVDLAAAVYGIDLTSAATLSVRDLANAFAAFRWGGLLKLHRTSAMEFPYSVAGLTDQHMRMRWPNIEERNAPDRPGSRFRMHFGAVPVVLSLNHPATV
jgi:flagellum-specific peptidoglycan hydrolase FlgJ